MQDSGDTAAWHKGLRLHAIHIGYSKLAKPNYQFEKRQRDLAKKAKQEEKRRQKLSAAAAADSGGAAAPQDPGAAAAAGSGQAEGPAPDGVTKPDD